MSCEFIARVSPNDKINVLVSHMSLITHFQGPGIVLPQAPSQPPSQKRKTEPTATQSDASAKKLKKAITHERREERNLREKDRSLKITQQIHELRNLLSLGGVIVPKVGLQ